MEKTVIKRNGDKVKFDHLKIVNAVDKACKSIEEPPMGFFVWHQLEDKGLPDEIGVEQIQDLVEEVLMQYNPKVARKYIKYRYDREQLRSIKPIDLVDKYLDESDWRVKENASVGYSLGGMILNNSGAVTANYWLNKVYPKEIGDAHRDCKFHIHDLSMLSGYCVGHNLLDLIKTGLGGVPGKITSAPPKHLSTLVNQIVNYCGTLSLEAAGAQAFSSFDTYLAPYVKYENLTRNQVYQELQSLMFSLNVSSRWGSQPVFSNITLDWTVPEDLAETYCWIGDKQVEFKYKDCQKEMDLINEILIDLFEHGDAEGRGFAYPIPTYSITKDFDWESSNAKKLFELTCKYGIPYFQNFINSDLNPSDVRSMCCRLRLDKRELFHRGGGLFGAAEQTGSIGVVTINLPQLGYLHKGDKKGFYMGLDHLLILAKDSLVLKRKTVQELFDGGFYPYSKHYIHTYDTFFNTIGINGCNECIRNFTNDEHNIADQWGQDFTNELLNYINSRLSDFQEETGLLFNLEAAPSEGTSYRLALHDKKNYPDIITAGGENGNPYYTNSTWLPANYTDDIFDALDIQDQFQTKYTGGTVFHAYLGERINNWKTCAELIKTIFTNYRLPYLTISPTYSVCPKHGYLEGEQKFCPRCRDEELQKIDEEIKKLEKELEVPNE